MSDRRPLVRAALDFLSQPIGLVASSGMQPFPPFGRCLCAAEGGSVMKNSYQSQTSSCAGRRTCSVSYEWIGGRRGQRNSANRPWLQARHRSDQSRRRRTSAVAIKRGHQYPDARGVALGVDDTRIETTVDWRNAEHAAAGDDDVGRLKRASRVAKRRRRPAGNHHRRLGARFEFGRVRSTVHFCKDNRVGHIRRATAIRADRLGR